MALPPRSFGTRTQPVLPKQVGEQRWGVTVGGRSLPPTFASEREARDTGVAEVVRLDAVSLALLRRIRSSLNRKRRWTRSARP